MNQPALERGTRAGTSIVLVDDHEVVRSGYRRFIEADASLTVAGEAASADEAYALLLRLDAGSRLPDLLVVDVSLGERSGLELIDRCSKRFAGLRSLVFSMHEDARIVEHALAAGASGYVSKSSPPETVLRAIAAIGQGERFIDPALAPVLEQRERQAQSWAALTRRELEIVSLLARGMDPADIAASLSLSAKTIANQLSSVRGKLKVSNDFQLMRRLAEGDLPSL